ncbi:hypothetical protein DL764_001094 [Monosporascus ibericus]|uniref:Uncharacterized protein n=1 Tax=Monosporascus ibericus TaxID=155417 RepID=A0A4V1XCH4_9PEZI|nr:hypothetical protein DL764_001094 [Monosporascus ibericus]
MPNKRRRSTRLLCSDSSDSQEESSESESTDDAGVAPGAKRTRSTYVKAKAQSLLTADAELAAEIGELSSKIRHGDLGLVEACWRLHGIEAKIEAHESRRQQFFDNYPAMYSASGFLPPGTHRKYCEDVKLEMTAAKVGILEKLQKEVVAIRESACTGIESLKKEIEAVKAYRISAEVIKKVIKETHAFQATQKTQVLQNGITACKDGSETTSHGPGVFRYISDHSQAESKRIYAWNFAEHLTTLDFRPPHGISGWSNISRQFHAYRLWGNGHLSYVLRDEGMPPICAKRHERGYSRDYSDKDSLKSTSLRSYTQSVMELETCGQSQIQTSIVLPRYVTFLGNLFGAFSGSEGGRPSYETSANNFCLVMDVTKPSKSVWLVYRYEFRKGGNIQEHEFHQDKNMFPSMEKEFDLALVCEDIRDWEEPNGSCELPHFNHEKVEHAMRRTACRVKLVFTRPNLDDLLVAIEEGWAGHGDGRNAAEADLIDDKA